MAVAVPVIRAFEQLRRYLKQTYGVDWQTNRLPDLPFPITHAHHWAVEGDEGDEPTELVECFLFWMMLKPT